MSLSQKHHVSRTGYMALPRQQGFLAFSDRKGLQIKISLMKETWGISFPKMVCWYLYFLKLFETKEPLSSWQVTAWPLIMAGDKWPLAFLLPSWYPSVFFAGRKGELVQIRRVIPTVPVSWPQIPCGRNREGVCLRSWAHLSGVLPLLA